MTWVTWACVGALPFLSGPYRARPALQAPDTSAPAQFETLDQTVQALYATISGPPGRARDWQRFRSLFRPDAKLMAAAPGEASVGRLVTMSPDEYIARNNDYLVREGFFETELARRTESFGAIAHVFSTYATRLGRPDAKAAQKGINSIQLWFDGKRWWIVSLVWQAETPRHPLPKKYGGGGWE